LGFILSPISRRTVGRFRARGVRIWGVGGDLKRCDAVSDSSQLASQYGEVFRIKNLEHVKNWGLGVAGLDAVPIEGAQREREAHVVRVRGRTPCLGGGCRIFGSGFRVQGSGSGFRVQDSEISGEGG